MSIELDLNMAVNFNLVHDSLSDVSDQLYVRNGMVDCKETKNEFIDWMWGIRCELDMIDSYGVNFRS